jgi:hypothetical protein
MYDEKTIQDWVTLSGPTSGAVVVQDCDLWVDMQGFDSVRLRSWISKATNVSLAVETATSPEGPWVAVVTKTTTGDQYDEIECDPDAFYQVARYLRWKLTSTDVTWRICFTLRGIFQKDQEARQYGGDTAAARTIRRPALANGGLGGNGTQRPATPGTTPVETNKGR